MDRMIHTALNSLKMILQNQQITSQNISNASVVGYRKDANSEFGTVYLNGEDQLNARVFATRQIGVFSNQQGELESTENPLDVAINGNGFFVVQPKIGEIALSRRGDFTVSADGTLRDGTGTQPLSVDLEPIIIPPHRKISISGDGIIQIEPLNAPIGQTVNVAQLATTFGSELPLAKSTDGFVRTINETIPEPDNRTRLLSGFLEGSNVKSVDELVTGIDQSRAYEINVKFISTAQEIDEASASLMRMPS